MAGEDSESARHVQRERTTIAKTQASGRGCATGSASLVCGSFARAFSNAAADSARLKGQLGDPAALAGVRYIRMRAQALHCARPASVWRATPRHASRVPKKLDSRQNVTPAFLCPSASVMSTGPGAASCCVQQNPLASLGHVRCDAAGG
jgi:hypothetical protein